MPSRRLLAAALFALLSLPSHAAQIPLAPDSPTPVSTTLVDVLSADPDYTSLLRLLQRARLIPTLNQLNNTIIFAPTNDAIKRRRERDSFWLAATSEDEAYTRNDNVQEVLRQELFYHMLDCTNSTCDLSSNSNPTVHRTLHYPRQSTEGPSQGPPSSPPWMPRPGGTLGGEPQRLRTHSRESELWAGVEASGDGGVKVVKDQQRAVNGAVVGIEDVLTVPSDLGSIIAKQDSLSYFNRIMTDHLANLLNDTNATTLFLPVDSAWESLHPVEKLYLESEFASDDLQKIFTLHAVTNKGVTWLDSLEDELKLRTVHGQKLYIKPENDKVTVSSLDFSADLVEQDIYAANGVIHTVSSLLLPPGVLDITPEKFLLTLNCSSFVSLLHSVGLQGLVNDTEAQYTILAPQDDVLSIYRKDDDLPEPGSEEMKRLLQYHFLPGRWVPSKLKDGMLVRTALEEPGLAGDKQVLDIELRDTLRVDEDPDIRFAGASTTGHHVEVNNTVIYFVSRPLVPPVDAFKVALPDLDLSTFLAAVSSTTLSSILFTQPRTTLLIPNNDAFKRLGGLVSDYLLRASSKVELERVLLHHALIGVEYAESIVDSSSKSYPTYEATDVHAERMNNGSIFLVGSGGWSDMTTALTLRNLLTQTGVLHELSDVMIPRSVNITIGKLARAAKASTMLNLVGKAGMDWVLNGTAPPEDSTWNKAGLTSTELTLLCPSDEAFKHVNLTELYADVPRMRAIVEQHLIPGPAAQVAAMDVLNNNRPLRLADDAGYETALSTTSLYGDVLFRATVDGAFIVGIRNTAGTGGNGDWARVVSWGRTTASRRMGGVILIDQLLVPYHPPWYTEYGAPIVGGAFGVLIICTFFWFVRWFWARDTTVATYEPIGQHILGD